MIRGAAAQAGKCAFLPAMRKDAQFFRRDAERVMKFSLTSGQLEMNQNLHQQRSQRSRRPSFPACPMPRSAGKKGAEYFPHKFAEGPGLTRKIDVLNLAA